MIETNLMTFKVALGREAHQLAGEFHRQQRYAKRAKQVYLNALAIYAVKYYLNCFGFSANLPTSELSESIERSLFNSADLKIRNIGKVECCPVLPNEAFCSIPLEARGNRLAYIAVRLNSELTEASLLGVLSGRDLEKRRDREKISLQFFQPLDNLFEYLEPPPTVLSQWWKNRIEDGWKTVEELFSDRPPILAFRSSVAPAPPPERQQNYLKLGRPVELKPGTTIVLCVGLEKVEFPGIDISVEVHPYGDERVLPTDLRLQILDEVGENILQAKTKGMEEELNFEFRGESGDRFSVQFDLDDETIVKPFLI
ncbi:MAG: DUF1822 family protein [Cyanobacteriota bacterium]|nr:DUF1822 family protein [Cyanobacteriota bacterium]